MGFSYGVGILGKIIGPLGPSFRWQNRNGLGSRGVVARLVTLDLEDRRTLREPG